MAGRIAPTQFPKQHASVHGLDVGKVATSLRRPFQISSTYKWLTLAMLLLGFFVAIEWQAPVAKGPVTADYPRELGKETTSRLEAEQKDLKSAIADRRTELTAIQKDAATRKTALADLNAQVESQRIQSGMVPLAGPGVQVVLDDSSVKSIPAGEDASHYIVHDYNIRDVVSLLWQSGAEAIAVGDERIVASTSIYCVGSTILVNDTRTSPPYKISAIGPPAMEDALNSPARLQQMKSDSRQYGVQFKVTGAKELQVPAYSGSFSIRYAQPGNAGSAP
jgi:uncharacterized protein YlxW (UPF0749 family)